MAEYCYKYPRPAVTVDLLAFAVESGSLRVLLVRRKADPFAGFWAIPGGFLNIDEPVNLGARRELREETGLIAGRIESLGQSHLSNSVSDEVAYLFRATELTHGESEPEGTERLQVRRFDWPTAWAMLQDGRITDSMSVIALLHEAIRRGSSADWKSG